MKRRAFIASVGASLFAVPLVPRAQKSATPVIGFLASASPERLTPFVAAFRQGLNETGYVEGKNVAIESRWAEDRYDRLPALAADLVQHDVAVLVASGGPASAIAAKAATSTIPIVFITGTDPIETGIVPSLGHPGGNATGVSFMAIELVALRLQLLHELMPKASVIAMIWNPNTPNGESEVRIAQEASGAFGQQLHAFRASTAEEIDAAFAGITKLRASALVVGSEPLYLSLREQIVALATRHALPAIFALREYVTTGGLISYGASLGDAYRQAGIYAGKILHGAKPANLPVRQPTKFELVINLKTAKALGLTIPQSLLRRADEVIR